MTSLIRDLAASTPEMLAAFDDEALVAAALRFERCLAEAQAAEGLLSERDAAAIADACSTRPDIAALAHAAAHAGTLAIPLVEWLRRRLGDGPAAAGLHRGATSQDLADTALMLQARTGLALLDRDVKRLLQALAGHAEARRSEAMLARTLLQPARATTFGLKAAGWLLAVDGAHRRLRSEAETALVLQFGGAAGTLAGLEGKALAVAARLGRLLELPAPPAPWHARREGVAGLGCALAILIGAIGKLAGDIALLAQAEVGEAFEPLTPGRGGSSSMSHKRNPTGCQVARSAAARAPHLAATLVCTLHDEHERGLGGWQAQGPVLAELFCLAHGATVAMAAVVEDLEIHPDRMGENLAAAKVETDVGAACELVDRALSSWRSEL